MRKVSLLAALAALVLATPTTPVSAQEAPQNVITTNPIGVVYGVYWGEYERVVGEQLSAAFSATRVDFFGFGVTNLDVKGRLYMGGTALEGFSMAMSGGIMNGSYEDVDCDPYYETCSSTSESKTFPTAGLELGYSWKMGNNTQFVISPRLGAKRIFATGFGNYAVIPTGGLTVGLAF